MVPLFKTSQWSPVASGSLYHVVEGLLWSGLCPPLHLLSYHTLSLGHKLQPWWAFFFPRSSDMPTPSWASALAVPISSDIPILGSFSKVPPQRSLLWPSHQAVRARIKKSPQNSLLGIFYKVANPLFPLPTPITFHRITLFSFLHRNQPYLRLSHIL